MIKAGVGALRLGVLWNIVHIPAHILARNPFLDPSRYEGVDSFEFTGLDFLSPGGGGPGQSLTSTTPPLSMEATGASLTQLGKPGGPASSSKRRSRSRRRKCPKGWHWSKQYNTCVRTAGFWKG